MHINIASFYQEGRPLGLAVLQLGNIETGAIEKGGISSRWRNLNNLETIFKEGLADLETEMGQRITLAADSNDYTDGFFEFIDTATDQPSIAFSTTQKPHIIIAADPGVDVRNWLPIKIEIKKDGNNFWTGKIDGNPLQVCRGPSGCSTNGPSGIGIDWKKIEITAYDKNNRVVATFGEIYNP